jgi:hypothetical protein
MTRGRGEQLAEAARADLQKAKVKKSIEKTHKKSSQQSSER